MPTAKKTSAKPARPARKSPARGAAAPGPSVAAATAATAPAGPFDAIEALKRTKTDLEAVRRQLREVDAAQLNDADRARHVQQLAKTSAAIEAARNALLDAIGDAFAAELPVLQQRTAELARALAQLNQAVAVINTVAAALGTIERIITLAG